MAERERKRNPSLLQGNAARPAVGRATQRSSLINNQCASSTTPIRSYWLRSLRTASNPRPTGARSIVLEANDESYPESPDKQTHTSEVPHENELPNSPFISLGHFNPHAQQEEFIQKYFTSEVVSQTEAEPPPGFHPIIPQSQSTEKLSERKLHVAEATVTPRAGGISKNRATSHIGNNILSNRCTSLNITEIALRYNDSNLDDEEVESSYNPAQVTVEGYRVKPEMAPLLRQFFAKHGDIAKDTVFESSGPRSHLLETVCCIYQNLKETNSAEVTSVQVDTMLHDVEYLESMKLNVGWLRTNITDIKEAMELLREYPTFKGKKAEIERKEANLKSYKADLASLQHVVRLLEDELTTLKTENVQTLGKFQERKDKIEAFIKKKSLVDGLL